METPFPLKLLLTLITLLTTPLLLIAAFLQTRKRHHNKTPSQPLCYLQTQPDPKPQTSFRRTLADNSYNPFKHLDRNETAFNRLLSNLSLYRAPTSHPYEEEINAVLGSCGVEEIGFVEGEVDLEMRGESVWVERKEELMELKEVLSKERVFGVDTEQHSLRSFLGFTALVQISTKSKDYLVDTIALHDVMDILRPVFANPKICKVFHGADNDVMWLQRDFHIYVVNLFDTAKACEVLSKPQKSLAYLLENYCGVIANKKLQLEDWRLRPLSEEMIQYARADAHYLLYIADRMATELKIKSAENPERFDDTNHFFRETVRLSNLVCLQRYTKEIEASPGNSAASSILSRYFNDQGGDSVNSETKELVERLCMWRDLMARVHDESLRYVLPDQAIASLASKSPTTAEEIYDIITEADMSLDSPTVDSTLSSPSPVVHSHLEGLCDILAEKIGSLGDTLETIIQKHIGTNGTCPLSIYNYALLTRSKPKVTSGFLSKTNGVKGPKRFGRKASRQLFVQKFSCKSPVYHNCRIYASDGRLLCYCDRRKLDWYLRRDLAKLVDNDPPAITLLFEPKGRPEDEDNDFYIQSKKNMCVGCGERNHYLRYRIIPSCYRVHFPEHLKSHRSHDIVLLCVDCHEVAHSYAEKHKKQIAAEFGIPLFVQRVVDSRQTENLTRTAGSVESVEEAGVSPLHLRSAAMALLRHGSEMPIKRREELTQIVMKFFGGRKITEEDLERALLVGMSPHERRRVEKKKGFSFRHSLGEHLSSKANNNVDCMDTSAIAEESECNLTNGSQKAEEGKHSNQEDENIRMKNSTSARDICKFCDSDATSKKIATDSKDTECKTTILEKENILGAEEDLACRMLSDDTSDFSQGGPNGTSRTYNKRLSLLGHGPHGKQVVDHLMKEYGEDGIRVFCQKWRQVFVESVNPRFLPSGWDVMHRGSRDFGDYSVYNPLKKATTADWSTL